MSYVKFTVDNVKCSRRFHLAFDSEDQTLDQVKVDCPYCGVKIFEARGHPKVKLLRQENLVKTQELSDILVTECRFRDELSEKTVPDSHPRYLYDETKSEHATSGDH